MRILKNATASVLQVVVSAVVLFILYRFILHTLGPESLGIWSIVLASVTASRIFELGLSTGVTRFVALEVSRNDALAVKEVVQTALISSTCLLFAAVLILGPALRVLFGYLFPPGTDQIAMSLLPYTLASLILLGIATVFQSALDGLQRYDLRAVLVIASQIVLCVAVMRLTATYGLLGLAWAQLIQAIFLVVGGWVLARLHMPNFQVLPLRWTRNRFRQLVTYGATQQVGSLAMLLFDPLTKILLGKFSTLAATGYYEMARQFVTKARMLIVAANQVVIPVATTLNDRNTDELAEIYRQNTRLLYFVALPLFSLVASWAPVVSEVWIGEFRSDFVVFSLALTIAWCVNTLATAAYFAQMGIGKIGWNAGASVWTGVANAIFGWLLGSEFGVPGVIVAMILSLVSGALLVWFGFHRVVSVPLAYSFPAESLLLLVGSLATAVANLWLYGTLRDAPTVLRWLSCVLVPLTCLALFLWLHPLRRTTLTRFRQRGLRHAGTGA